MYFTDRIADYIVENKLDLKHLTIILPSERAKKYIAASLFRNLKQPVLAPEMLTIDRWVRQLSDKTVIDKTRALLRLYEVQQEDQTSIPEPFDEFLNWGTILLSDYDEIDRYLLNSEQVFKNLADIREIENWSFGNEQLSEGQKRYMEFWDKLPGFYRNLNKKLDAEGVCYMGKAYRFVAEQIDVVFRKDKERVFLFAGFNALSPAEISIMKQLHRLGRGHILINADSYYLEKSGHEAGRFIRHLKEELVIKELPYVENRIAETEKQVEVIECSQHTGQVKAASTILAKLSKEEIDQTLLLLADESLIAPLLQNLPLSIGKANITLGLPLRDTSLRTWVDLIFTMQDNKTRFQTDAVYIHDLKKLWNHPFIIALLSPEEQEKIIERELVMVRRNTIFQQAEHIKIGQVPDEVLQLLTARWENNWQTALQLIRQLNRLLYRSLDQTHAFEKAIIQGFDNALQDFENILSEGIPDMSVHSFKHLFQQHWNTKSIAYHGNPLDGLQIMGLLETRLLDFKNILVLGLNEGKMPPTNPIQTMIPMDLRKYLQLPTPREKQGLFAHHFYRLLHHCEHMWITYTSAQEAIGSNEASRYLVQMELEMSRQLPNVHISKQFYSIPNEESETEVQHVVEKTPAILHKMDELFSRAVSASALNKYLTCPLDFYYRYVMDFGESEEVEEEVESNTFGTFIHNVLEQLYTPFARHDKQGNLKTTQVPAITSFDIDNMLKKYELLINEQFINHFNGDKRAFTSGKNLLTYKMALEQTRRILENEKRFLSKQTEPVFIEYLEVELQSELKLEIAGKIKQLHLKGFIDRIDSVGGKMRIIDYKSGKVEKSDVCLNTGKGDQNLIKQFSSGKHVLQLSLYIYLYHAHFGAYPEQSAIYSLINLNEDLFRLDLKEKSIPELVELFPQFLQELFEEIYDTEIPFAHQSKGQYSYCLYCE